MVTRTTGRWTHVSIHAPARGATDFGGLAFDQIGVSIHAPARGATRPTARQAPDRRGFNSRAREGRDPCLRFPRRNCRFQFTRPRGARPANAGRSRTRKTVSIHAPARGATTPIRAGRRAEEVSIHAPARGATSRAASGCGASTTFQFTRPRGARHRARRQAVLRQGVSIHAPARGATSSAPSSPRGWRSFNSRAREGRDAQSVSMNIDTGEFQFTRPRGARRSTRATSRGGSPFQFTRPRGARRVVLSSVFSCFCFNSRAREGRDH